MTTFLFANNVDTTLGAVLSPTATTMTVATGTGAAFPSPAAGQQFAVTLYDAATAKVTEIVYCTARTADVLTITRAREGTIATAFITGDFAVMLITAGVAAAFAQAGFALVTPRANTAPRPATPALGQQYFDTDLAQPIWCNGTGPSVWVNSAGVPV